MVETRTRKFMKALITALLALVVSSTAFAAPPQDTLAQRVLACTGCHGKEGRAAPDGYHPRIAGKPAAYLFNQLVNFREGRRRYGPMVYLVDHLGDDYLHEIAEHFAAIELPYPAPAPANDDAATLARGEALALRGDEARKLPACAACHGRALTGVMPATPGLLGLPRDYLKGQLGAWTNGQRRAHAPDCMADVAKRLTPEDVSAIAAWLASRAVPPSSRAVAPSPIAPPLECGSVPR